MLRLPHALFLSSAILILGLYLTSLTIVEYQPSTRLRFSNNSLITIGPRGNWSFTYIWIDTEVMDVSYVDKLLRDLDMDPIAKQGVQELIEYNIVGEIMAERFWITVRPTEPRELAIGINISKITPSNAELELGIALPSGMTKNLTLRSFDTPYTSYAQLCCSGVYTFTLVNRGSTTVTLRVELIRSYVILAKPYLLYGLAMLVIAILSLIYSIRKL